MIRLEMRGQILAVEHNVRFGREPRWADVVLTDDRISRYHAEIRLTDGTYRVWDMGSRNRTTVNGRPVGAAGEPLQTGDRIRLGDVVEIVVVDATTTGSTASSTAAGPGAELLTVAMMDNRFTVTYVRGGKVVRDTIAYQLGLALTLLVHYQREGFGPVLDGDLRAFVWRGDREQMRRGDINRLLLRLRSWFRDHEVEPPRITRAMRSFKTHLELPPASLSIKPEGWYEPYIDE